VSSIFFANGRLSGLRSIIDWERDGVDEAVREGRVRDSCGRITRHSEKAPTHLIRIADNLGANRKTSVRGFALLIAP